MKVHIVSHEQGWEGMALALADAQAGDQVEIGPGRFEGGETLYVPSGVTLSGQPDHILIYTGDGVAVAVRDAQDVTIDALNLSGWHGQPDFQEFSAEVSNTCLIQVGESRNITIRNCTVTAQAMRGACITALCSTGVDVTFSRMSGALIGVAYISSAGRIEENDCWGTSVSGIALTFTRVRPSSALIRTNRCHEGRGAGILLIGSNSEGIEDNECWGNRGSGIVLQCSESKFQAGPSSALIRANRCHENREAGILLVASNSEGIEDNECWGNHKSGIVLQCDETEFQAGPSSALIRANRCHENREDGIELSSSNSEGIEDNECWGNHGNGIYLLRSSKSPDAPSSALIRANRLQGNRGEAILFTGSTGRAVGNRFKDNGINGAEFMEEEATDSLVATWPHPRRDEGNKTDQTLDLPALFLPTLRAQLDARCRTSSNAPRHSTTGLAGFLTSGCSGCFHRFWTGQRHMGEQAEAKPVRPDPRLRTLITKDSAEPQLMRGKMVKSSLLDDLHRQIEGWRLKTDNGVMGCVHWLALVSPDESDLDQINYRIGEHAATPQDGSYAAGGILGRAVNIGADTGGGDQGFRSQLTDELMQGRRIWRERLGVMCRWWPALFLFGGLFLAAFLGWPWMFSSVKTFIDELQVDNWGIIRWVLAGISVIAGIAGTLLAGFWFIDLFLPMHLRFRSMSRTPRTIVAPAGIGLPPSPAELIAEQGWFQEWRQARPELAELSWQIRRLLGGKSTVVPLVLRGITGWPEGDLGWLNRLSNSVPEGHSLIVLMHVDGRLSLRPIFVDPDIRPWAAGLEVYLNDNEERLRLQKRAADMPDTPLSELFAPFGITDNEKAKGLRNELRNDQWTPRDLLPGLCVASAPTARSALRRLHGVTNSALHQEPLAQSFVAASDFFVGMVPDPSCNEVIAIDALFDFPEDARAIRLDPENMDGNDYDVLTGRVSARKAVGELLHQLWPDGTDWEEYVASALRFGIWQRVTGLSSRLSQPPEDSYGVLQTLRDLEGLCFLGQDLTEIQKSGCPIFGEERYQKVWDELRQAMENMPAGPRYGNIISSFLAAESFCLDQPSPLGDALIVQIEELLAVEASSLSPTNASDCFCLDTARAILEMRAMEPPARDQRLTELHGLQWKGLPSGIAAKLKELIHLSPTDQLNLSRRFAMAKDEDEIEAVVRLHARHPERVIYALAFAAIHWVLRDSKWQVGATTPDEALASLGVTLVKLRAEIVGKDAWLHEDFAKDAVGGSTDGAIAAALLAQSDAAQRLHGWLSLESTDQFETAEAELALELAEYYRSAASS